MPHKSKIKRPAAVLLALLLTLTLFPVPPAQALGTTHTIDAWDDARLGDGLPGVASGDTIILPAVEAADTYLIIPAEITELVIEGRADYTNLSIEAADGHPGVALTILNLSLTAPSGFGADGYGHFGIDFSGSTESSLFFSGTIRSAAASSCRRAAPCP